VRHWQWSYKQEGKTIVMEIGSPFGEFSVVQEQRGPITTEQHCYSFNNEGYCRNQKFASVTSVKSVNKIVMDKNFAPSVRPQINFKQMHQENLNNLPQNKNQTHLNDYAITTPTVNANLISL
jgi:hypothetical protein